MHQGGGPDGDTLLASLASDIELPYVGSRKDPRVEQACHKGPGGEVSLQKGHINI